MQVDVGASLGNGQQTLQDEALSLKLFQGVELSALEGAKVTQTLHAHTQITLHMDRTVRPWFARILPSWLTGR